jgi:hypothetical protein
VGGLILAWAAGNGIMIYRARVQRRPPLPGQLLAANALFALLAAAAEYQPARAAATLFAVGVDVAVLMQVLPGGADAPKKPAKKTTAATTGGGGGTGHTQGGEPA